MTSSRIRHGPVWSLDLGPDGRIMASGSSDSSVILRDYATGDMLRRLEGHMGWIFDVGFSADGERLYSASADGTVREWRVSNWPLGDVKNWAHENRYVREFTCEECDLYRIESACE